jgi:hypothetical protein
VEQINHFHSKLTDGYTAERNVPHYVPHYGIEPLHAETG